MNRALKIGAVALVLALLPVRIDASFSFLVAPAYCRADALPGYIETFAELGVLGTQPIILWSNDLGGSYDMATLLTATPTNQGPSSGWKVEPVMRGLTTDWNDETEDYLAVAQDNDLLLCAFLCWQVPPTIEETSERGVLAATIGTGTGRQPRTWQVQSLGPEFTSASEVVATIVHGDPVVVTHDLSHWRLAWGKTASLGNALEWYVSKEFTGSAVACTQAGERLAVLVYGPEGKLALVSPPENGKINVVQVDLPFPVPSLVTYVSAFSSTDYLYFTYSWEHPTITYCPLASIEDSDAWTTSQITTAHPVWPHDATICNGVPVVALSTKGGLSYAVAKSRTPQGPVDWESHRIYRGGVQDVSLAVVGGNPAMSFIDHNRRVLKYAWASSPHPSSGRDWRATTVIQGDPYKGEEAIKLPRNIWLPVGGSLLALLIAAAIVLTWRRRTYMG